MDKKSLMKIIHANDKEIKVLEAFINKFGYKSLISFLELGLPVQSLSQKTKQALYSVDQVLHNSCDALVCLSRLTEIPLKSILYMHKNRIEIIDILEHPEKFDLDSRQSYAFRCMNEVYTSYQEDQKRETVQQLGVNHDYEIER